MSWSLSYVNGSGKVIGTLNNVCKTVFRVFSEGTCVSNNLSWRRYLPITLKKIHLTIEKWTYFVSIQFIIIIIIIINLSLLSSLFGHFGMGDGLRLQACLIYHTWRGVRMIPFKNIAKITPFSVSLLTTLFKV